MLTSPLTRFERGFRSGEAKLAFHNGHIEAEVPLPPGLLDMLRGSEAGPQPVPRGKGRQTPLRITQASAGQAQFATDRGRQELPAWQLSGPGIDGAFWALDPAVAAQRWEPPQPAPPTPFGGLPHRSGSAAIEDDDRILHFSFTGSPAAVADYPAADVIETAQALVIIPVERDIGPPGFRAAVGQGRTVTARLAQPLRGRVLVDLDASPTMVTAWSPA